MEKFIFLATVKDRLTEMNLPQESIDKHVKIFEECFKGKNAEEIDGVIESAGGIDGIIKSIQNLENAKQKNTSDSSTTKTSDKTEINTPNDEGTTPSVVAETEHTPTEKTLNEVSDDEPNDSDVPTMEIPKAPNIDKHIREAEEMTETLERIAVSHTNNDEEFLAELSEYDFEMLFEEKLSKIEMFLKNLRQKLSLKKYKSTLPIAIIIAALVFVFVSILFPLLIASAVIFSVAYICILVAGLCFAILPIGYGIYMCFKSMPIALYELSIGIISSGITMFSSILLYNYVKRLVPYLFKELVKLFKFCIKLTKMYFGKQVKEEV